MIKNGYESLSFITCHHEAVSQLSFSATQYKAIFTIKLWGLV